jgi:hypothetical protein
MKAHHRKNAKHFRQRAKPKENILTKKEIGKYDERKCHLFCDSNFYEF